MRLRRVLDAHLALRAPALAVATGRRDEPTWIFEAFDAIEDGLERMADAGSIFSVSWDTSGIHEGIGLQRDPMLGSAVGSDADGAIGDVGARAVSWRRMVAMRVTTGDLYYRPRGDVSGSLSCTALHDPRGRRRC